ALEVERFALQAVRPRQLHHRARDRELELRQPERSVSELERALEIRHDAGLLALRRIAASAMAQLIDLALHVVAGEARLADRKATVELQPIDDIAVAGGQQ